MNEQVRFDWMDRTRGLAILLLLVLHATAIPALFGGFTTAYWLDVFNSYAAPARMPVLMFLSGMLLQRSLAKPLGRFYSGKLRILLWTYVVWAVIHLALTGRLEELITPWTWVQTIYLWFISFILVYYLLGPILAKVPAWLPILPAIGLYLGFSVVERGFILKFFFYWVFFLCGDLFVRLRAERFLVHQWGRIIATLLLLTVMLVPMSGAGALAGAGWRLLTAMVVVAFVLAWAPLVLNFEVNDPMRSIGRNSLVYYVSHFPLMVLTTWALVRLGVTQSWLAFIACLLVAIGVAALLVRGRRWAMIDALFAAPGLPASNRD